MKIKTKIFYYRWLRQYPRDVLEGAEAIRFLLAPPRFITAPKKYTKHLITSYIAFGVVAICNLDARLLQIVAPLYVAFMVCDGALTAYTSHRFCAFTRFLMPILDSKATLALIKRGARGGDMSEEQKHFVTAIHKVLATTSERQPSE